MASWNFVIFVGGSWGLGPVHDIENDLTTWQNVPGLFLCLWNAGTNGNLEGEYQNSYQQLDTHMNISEMYDMTSCGSEKRGASDPNSCKVGIHYHLNQVCLSILRGSSFSQVSNAWGSHLYAHHLHISSEQILPAITYPTKGSLYYQPKQCNC